LRIDDIRVVAGSPGVGRLRTVLRSAWFFLAPFDVWLSC
jgi:hypothetical protein